MFEPGMLYQLTHTEGHLQLVLNIFYKRTYVYNHVYCFSLNRCWSLRDQMLMPRDQTFWNYKVGSDLFYAFILKQCWLCFYDHVHVHVYVHCICVFQVNSSWNSAIWRSPCSKPWTPLRVRSWTMTASSVTLRPWRRKRQRWPARWRRRMW